MSQSLLLPNYWNPARSSAIFDELSLSMMSEDCYLQGSSSSILASMYDLKCRKADWPCGSAWMIPSISVNWYWKPENMESKCSPARYSRKTTQKSRVYD